MILRISIILLMLGLAVYFGPAYLGLEQFSLSSLGIILLLQILVITLAGLAFELLCSPLHIKLHWHDWLGLSFVANLLNQFLPYRSGMAFRYFYLRKRYPFSFVSFMVTMLVYLWLNLLVNVALGSFAVERALTVFLVCMSVLSIGIFYTLPWWLTKIQIRLSSKWAQRLTLFSEPLQQLHQHPKAIIYSAGVLLIMNIITALIFYLIFDVLKGTMALKDCLLLVSTLNIVNLFPLLPGNLGILEALVGGFTTLLYQDFNLGVLVVLFYRLIQALPALILGGFFSWHLLGYVLPRKN